MSDLQIGCSDFGIGHRINNGPGDGGQADMPYWKKPQKKQTEDFEIFFFKKKEKKRDKNQTSEI